MTPEAITSAQAFGGRQPQNTIDVSAADLEAVYAAYRYVDSQANVVVFSGPQLSIFEMQRLAERFRGRYVATGMHENPARSLFLHSPATNEDPRRKWLDQLDFQLG
mgnify:CR=1 FL=1